MANKTQLSGKKAEKDLIEFRLRERERFLRTLISNLPGVVFRCRADDDFTKEFVSDGCFELTGYKPAELTGDAALTTWSDLMHPEDRERVFADVRQMMNAENGLYRGEQLQSSYRIVARDNSIKHVRDRFRFVHDSNGEIIALEGFVADITERALADERVRESEDRYRLLAENMRDLVCLHELDGKYLYVSPSSANLLGFAPEELIGKSPYDLIHREDAERIRAESHDQLLAGETGIVTEYRMQRKTGEWVWVETMAQTVNDESGKTIQLQTVTRDVSKRKEAEAEREKAQEELARLLLSEQEARHEAETARVEAEHANRVKDEFVQMVSHEFRTPLTTIKTLVRVLQHDGENREERQEYLESIAAECDRQIDLILNLLDVSRLEEGQLDLKSEPVDVNRLLGSCDRIERHAAEARRQAFIVQEFTDEPQARGDEKALRRALCTIIENAIKYTPENGIINVSARHVVRPHQRNDQESELRIAAELYGDLPPHVAPEPDEKLPAEEIVIVVCDTGRGIMPEDLEKIFHKFYRGKKPVPHDTATDGTFDDAAGIAETPGVGLGLYLAKRLINALDGRIRVSSEVGRGSCFTIFLPVWKPETHQVDAIDEYNFDEGIQAQ